MKFRAGVLIRHLDGFGEALLQGGYSQATRMEYVRFAAQFGRWLGERGSRVRDINEVQVRRFLLHRRRGGRLCRGHHASLRMLLEQLRRVGAVPPASAPPSNARMGLEHEFRGYLSEERGLRPTTIRRYLDEIRSFLSYRFRRARLVPSSIRAQDVNDFVSRRSQHLAPRTMKLTVTALRAFCRFLRLRGDVASEIANAVLTVPNWRLASLPKWISAAQFKQILQQCDRRTTVGQRNYTILLLLARLGLRAGEVVAMTLDDVDWEAGELLVRGKGPRQERLPLPNDVGREMARYVRRGRPRCSSRHFFVRARAPLVGFASPAAITTVVERAIDRAGLDLPSRGAHLLRHTLATDVLRGGGTLAEIGELLRHRHPDTTALYAKVDLVALRSVAPPWPGAGRQ